MIEWTAGPSLLPRITFGKHRGANWSDVPFDYLEWLAFKSDMDADTKFTAKHWIQQRGAARRAAAGGF
jgi:exodeoxyribonuclease X